MRLDVFFTHNEVKQGDTMGRLVIIVDVLRASTTVATALGNGAKHVDGPGHCEELALLAVDVERILTAPVGRMEDEAPARLDRAAVMDRAIRRICRIDIELSKQHTKADAGPLVADSDPDGAIFVVHAQCNDRALEARIGHSRHCQQQFAGQERGLLRHSATMGRPAASGNT